MGAARSRARMNNSGMAAPKGSSAPTGASDVAADDTNKKSRSLAQEALQPPVPDQRLQRILEMIDSGIPCTIQALAEECNLSHSRLQHLFKQKTGISLGQRLTQQRLARAAHLLMHTDKRIKDIARAIGYEHASSFIRAFERYFAQAPRRYRQAQKRKAAGAC